MQIKFALPNNTEINDNLADFMLVDINLLTAPSYKTYSIVKLFLPVAIKIYD